MKPFTVPPWEKDAQIVEFKPIMQSTNNNKPVAKKQKKKTKNRKKAKETSTVAGPVVNSVFKPGRGPLAPPVYSSDDEADDEMRATMRKIKSGRIEKQRPPSIATSKGNNKKKQLQTLTLNPELAQAAVEAMENTATPATTSLANKLQAELMGGRFRFINEQLYTMDSRKAEGLFKADSTAFEAYHAGYRQQVEKWPKNPLLRIIKTIKRLPKTTIIGDFGCGDGKLAQSVPNKVYSMDLVSTRADIIACNITATPLQAQCLDVAVYCLSLMGTNLNDYLVEANRVLKLHGNVYIVEIQSRFEDVREFMRCMHDCGFDLIKKDVAVNYFYFFHFKKMRHVSKVAKLKPFSLKPCLYRKR